MLSSCPTLSLEPAVHILGERNDRRGSAAAGNMGILPLIDLLQSSSLQAEAKAQFHVE